MQALGRGHAAAKAPRRQQVGTTKIAVRFRNINIMLFMLALCIMAAVMAAAFAGAIIKLSTEYARRYGASSAEALSARIGKEIGLLSKAARSNAVIDWLQDEGDYPKKRSAFEEMDGIVGELYSFNLYIGFEGSLHEYRVEKGFATDVFMPFDTLDSGNPDDAWYFECIGSPNGYVLSVGIDHVMQRKRVWLDFKVAQDGAPIGVVCTGLEFSHLAGELFSGYDGSGMRGIVVDESGAIQMDSALMGNDAFLYHETDARIEDEFSDPALLEAILSRRGGAEGYFEETGEPSVIRLPSGPYRYITIAPIKHTSWQAVILSGTPPQFGWPLFIPISLTMFILLVAFALASNAANYRLVFHPLGKLDRSLAQLKENSEAVIYGTERGDELGKLSKTIQELFTKANVDALTGIYNRHFMENNLEHTMEMLSRSNGLLSVLMIDVDYFKKYNDTYGHGQGDLCLKKVAQALAGGVARANDFAARYGGEEFAAILPNTGEDGARIVAEKLLEGVRALGIPHSGNAAAPHVTISIGVTTGRVAYMHSWGSYIKRADEALYMSKQDGRDRYSFLPFQEKP